MPIGERLMRLEDRPLLTGTARFVDDIQVPEALEAAFVRSPVAHGRLLEPGLGAAAAIEGVEAAIAAEDLDLPPIRPPCTNPDVTTPPQPVLARGKVRFAGEPIAVVVAGSRYLAEDACEAADPEIEPLDPIVDPRRAIDAAAAPIHDGISNLVVDTRLEQGDVDGGFDDAALVIERTFRTPRQSGTPIEGRAVLARPERDALTVWSSTQSPHKLRQAICEALGLGEAEVRVIAPDIGGGFGLKAHVYPEEIAIAALALRLGRAVKWTEDRVENLGASTHARDQELRVKAGISSKGDLLALDVDMLCDQGAYGAYPHGVSLEALTTSGMIPGPYRLRNYRMRARTALTNKSPEGAYRGVGFVVASFVHERVIEALAREGGLDPAEIRRRNLIGPDELPYVSVTHHPYDSGDYGRALELALERIGYDGLVDQRERYASSGRRLGVGLACYVEPTAMNSKVFEGRGMVGIAGYDGAHVALAADGKANVWTTTPAIGQGTATTMAQLAAAGLDMDPADVRVGNADSGIGELRGTGAFASRSAVSAGGALTEVCATLRRRLVEDAAEELEAAEVDLRIEDGRVYVAGSPDDGVAVSDLVAQAPERFRLSAMFDPPQSVYPYATHACLVAVDQETGYVSIERYVIVEDCGRMINPVVVEGQVHGATAQGLGGALYEGHDYDQLGQLRTASLMDYVIPAATETPEIELLHLELPSPITKTGVKGVGEGGTIAPAPAIANALGDALDAEFNSLPIRPEDVLAIAARGSRKGGPR